MRPRAECASRNPSYLALHLEPEHVAALARSIIEEALERVAITQVCALPIFLESP